MGFGTRPPQAAYCCCCCCCYCCRPVCRLGRRLRRYGSQASRCQLFRADERGRCFGARDRCPLVAGTTSMVSANARAGEEPRSVCPAAPTAGNNNCPAMVCAALGRIGLASTLPPTSPDAKRLRFALRSSRRLRRSATRSCLVFRHQRWRAACCSLLRLSRVHAGTLVLVKLMHAAG